MLDLFQNQHIHTALEVVLICRSYKMKIVRHGTETSTYLGPNI